MIINPYRFGGAAIIGNVQFDPTQCHSTITLSGGNLIARGNAGSGGHVKSLVAHATGKRYVEMTLEDWSSSGSGAVGVLGLVPAATALSTIIGGGAGGTAVWSVLSGGPVQTYFEGTPTAVAGAAVPNGTIFGLAWDADTGRVWFSRDGTWLSGDPAAGTSPTYTAASLTGAHHFGACPRNLNNRVQARVTPVYPVPTGFSYW